MYFDVTAGTYPVQSDSVILTALVVNTFVFSVSCTQVVFSILCVYAVKLA